MFRPAEVVGSIHPDGHADAAGQSSLCFGPGVITIITTGGAVVRTLYSTEHGVLASTAVLRQRHWLLYGPSILQGSHDGPQLKASRALLR